MSLATDFRDIRTGESDAVLAGVWRQIMRNYGMDRARLDDLVTEYSKKLTYLPEEKRAQWRSNILSDLLSESMSWRTFLRGIRCLNTSKMGFTLKLHHLTVMTEHSFVLDFEPPSVDIDSSEDGQRKPPTELHLFYTSIMRDLGVSAMDVQSLLTRYMIRTRVPLTPKNRTHVRGNIKKELFGERLSWASFIRGLNFLEITKFELIITLYPQKGKSVKHRRVIILNDEQDLREELDTIATIKEEKVDE